MEPKYDDYVNFSPYNYSNNNSLIFRDYNGKDAILITFPNYRIGVGTGSGIPGLGHQGVLLIDNLTGKANYFEFGRYNEGKGWVRTKEYEVKTEWGEVIKDELQQLMKQISTDWGSGGEVSGVYIESDEFKKMYDYAYSKYNEVRKKEYKDDYDLLNNNCSTFAQDVIRQDENINTPPKGESNPKISNNI